MAPAGRIAVATQFAQHRILVYIMPPNGTPTAGALLPSTRSHSRSLAHVRARVNARTRSAPLPEHTKRPTSAD